MSARDIPATFVGGHERAATALVVPAALRACVARANGQHTPAAAGEVLLARLPACESTLVVHITPGGAVRATVSGPLTAAKYRLIVPGPFYVQMIVRPSAARALLGVPLSELADRAVDLHELWGRSGDEVAERAARLAADPQAALRAIEPLLAARVPVDEASAGARLAERAIERFAATAAAEPTVEALARDLGASERTLRQAFADHVGVSPKRYARIERIRRVAARAGSRSWTQLAAEHGFSDQAHMNGEFRALLGVSPGAFIARRFPATHPAHLARPARPGAGG